jgi:hypothetical protein
MARTLEKDGVNLAFKTLPEVRTKMRGESERQAKRRGASGGELRGSAYAMNALVCYFLTRTKADRERIVDMGRSILDRLFEMEEDSLLSEVSSLGEHPDPSVPATTKTKPLRKGEAVRPDGGTVPDDRPSGRS